MLIPFLPKDPTRSDIACRDGEIDFIIGCGNPAEGDNPGILPGIDDAGLSAAPVPHLTAEKTTPTCNIRIPLQSGDRPKAELLLTGEISRVDPETAERLIRAIVVEGAQCLLDISTELRREGLFLLPFRCYSMLQTPDGTLSYPSAQAVALPVDFPPHPEITAASVTDDAMTLALRFPVRPHRLSFTLPSGLPEGYAFRIFISYPLYIPDPKEMRGSLGSVRSATGGNALGIRFAFLSTSAVKASVAAPEKYYEMVGNGRTGYRISSKSAVAPDYSCYAAHYGYVPPFARESMLALGEGVDAAADPLDWIADWNKRGEGYLPASLPYNMYSQSGGGVGSPTVWPEGIDADAVLTEAEALGVSGILLTRPMAFASDAQSRRNATPRAIRSIRVLGLDASAPASAILYGSDDCRRWKAERRFDPRRESHVLTSPRLFWRLLIMGSGHSDRYAVGVLY